MSEEKKVRKGRKAPVVERTSILPNFSAEQGRKLQEAIDKKQHLEYLCFMLLNHLNRTVPLEQLLKIGVQRGIVEEDALLDFFGDSANEESGSCEAEGKTIPVLLQEWLDATDNMMGLMAGR